MRVNRLMAALLAAAIAAALLAAACGGERLSPSPTPLPLAAPEFQGMPAADATPVPPPESPRLGWRECQESGYCGLLNLGGRITAAAWLDAHRMYVADYEGRIRLLDIESQETLTVLEGLSIRAGLTVLDNRLYISDMGNVCAYIREIEEDGQLCQPAGLGRQRRLELKPVISQILSNSAARILSYAVGEAGTLSDRQVALDGVLSWEQTHSVNGLTNDGEYVYASIGHPDWSGGAETGDWITELLDEIGAGAAQKELMGSIIRFRPGGRIETYAAGFRNTYGISIAPSGMIYGADNDESRAGTEDRQLEELNAIAPGQFYGWPYWGTRQAPAEAEVTEPAAILEGTASTVAHANSDGVYVAYLNSQDGISVDFFDYQTFTPRRVFAKGVYYITAILEKEGLLYLATIDGFIHLIDPAAPVTRGVPIAANRSGRFYTEAAMNEIIAAHSPPGPIPELQCISERQRTGICQRCLRARPGYQPLVPAAHLSGGSWRPSRMAPGRPL